MQQLIQLLNSETLMSCNSAIPKMQKLTTCTSGRGT